MQNKKYYLLSIFVGLILVFVSGLWLASAQPVKAQCGSQASSCKNCHEVQGQKSVNSDGTGWHQSHAFGDFCYICHAGNQQATDKVASHTGMVPPLQDVKSACTSCHVKDTAARAQVYADKLGIAIGAGSPPNASSPTNGTDVPPAASAPANPPAMGNGVVVENQPVIDYVEQYNETVLGKAAVNWGNAIVSVLIVLIVIIGGVVVFFNERKLRGASMPQAPKSGGEPEAVRLEDYQQEILELLPKIKALNPAGRKALGRLIADPEAASELLIILSRLDPDLVKRMQGLDREAQALLIVAHAGDAILAPAIGTRSGLVVAEVAPRVAIGAVVLAHCAPLSLTEVRPPSPPRHSSASLCQPSAFSGVSHAWQCATHPDHAGTGFTCRSPGRQ